MKRDSTFKLELVIAWGWILTTWAAFPDTPPNPEMAPISGGLLKRLDILPGDPKQVTVKAFLLDRFLVTNQDFLHFVQANQEWRRSSVVRLFADQNYLIHWDNDLELGPTVSPRQPVVWISWFAACAYAEWVGKRLPTVDEWEFAASASASDPDGATDPTHLSTIAQWYSLPSLDTLPDIGMTPPNYWGIHDLHQLVWEWTEDFNSALLSGDSRSGGGKNRELFCGGGAAFSADPSNFPYYLRQGMRNSLKADYTMRHLGFRCAKDL